MDVLIFLLGVFVAWFVVPLLIAYITRVIAYSWETGKLKAMDASIKEILKNGKKKK